MKIDWSTHSLLMEDGLTTWITGRGFIKDDYVYLPSCGLCAKVDDKVAEVLEHED